MKRDTLLNEIEAVFGCFDHNRLVLNWKKTSGMIVSRYLDSCILGSSLGFRGNQIAFVGEFKLLGFTII